MIATSLTRRKALLARSFGAAAIAFGAVAGLAATVTPAMAQRQPKPAKQAPLKLSPEFQKVAVPLNAAIEAAGKRPDVAAARGNPAALASALANEKAQLEQATALATNADDRLLAGQFAVSLGGLAQDMALQRRGVQAMLASGKASPADAPRLHFFAGQFAYNAKEYAAARTEFQAAVDGGYTENDVYLLLAESYISDNQVAQGLTILKQAVERHKAIGPVPEAWYKRGLIAAYRAGATTEAVSFGNDLVRAFPTKQNWGLAITIIREVGKFQPQDMVDLLRLMGRTDSYAEARDYLEYIEAADPRRLPGEVIKVIDAGTASGKLRASDPTVADYRTTASGRIAADRASLPGLERDARAANASVATVMGGGDAFLSYGEAAKAEALYTLALNKPGTDQERALTRIGIAQVDQGKYADAQATFAKVTGPRKSIADLWAAYAASKAQPAA